MDRKIDRNTDSTEIKLYFSRILNITFLSIN